MEIEKKFLLKNLPDDLERYEKWDIEQCYLCSSPVIRIRKKNEEYILTYKNRPPKKEKDLCMSEEVELPLTKESYLHLKEKADGLCIEKTRYLIPYENYVIELDVFHGEQKGILLAEVEFDTVEDSKKFMAPSWFAEDVSDDYHYSNCYMSLKKI